MIIKKMYFEIFADHIESINRLKNPMYGRKEMYFRALLVFSLAQLLNIGILLFILIGLGVNVDIFFEFDIFPGKILNGFLSSFITFILPLMLINYLLVFHKKTYLKYTDNRRINTGGWALMIYFMGSAFAFIMYMVIGKLFF
jgi:hypothetical protein